MGNLGGMEIIVIMIVALIVLGPKKLPDAARQLGKVATELRRISRGFQREMREAMEDPIVEAEARAKGAQVTQAASSATKTSTESEAETTTKTSTEPEAKTTTATITDGPQPENPAP